MRFATLGPAGSNHALVLGRYLENRGHADAEVCLFTAFPEAFDALLAGRVDRVLQCTAHFSHAECVGRTMHQAFPVDTFIAGSQPLALLARAEAAAPVSVGLQPATRHYTDLSAFVERQDYATIVEVAAALLAGDIDAGICAREALACHPEQLRLIKDLGPALDAWVLYGTRPLPENHPVVVA